MCVKKMARLVERRIPVGSSRGLVAYLLIILSLSTVVFGEVTYLWEDFEEIDNLNNLSANWVTIVNDIGILSVQDGYLFLNLTQEEYSPGHLGEAIVDGPSDKSLSFVGLEVRLRCSSNNQLNSDIGGGQRFWGFSKKTENTLRGFHFLSFESRSADSDWGPAGFRVLSMVAGQTLFSQPIDGVDIREWHNYTILWRPGNATFLVDGVIVATTTNVPEENLRVLFKLDIDIMQHGTWVPQPVIFPCESTDLVKVCTDEYIQIDYIRIFLEEERFKEMEREVSGLHSHALELIKGLEQRGENTTQLWTDYGESQENWQKNHYFYDEDYQHIENMIDAIEQWDQITLMFTQAEEAIKELEQHGKNREATISKGDYNRAEKAWAEYDYETTLVYLQKILDKASEIPEPTLLPILALILPLILLQRKME